MTFFSFFTVVTFFTFLTGLATLVVFFGVAVLAALALTLAGVLGVFLAPVRLEAEVLLAGAEEAEGRPCEVDAPPFPFLKVWNMVSSS